MAIEPAIRETSNVIFCNQICSELKKDTTKVNRDTIALVEPTSVLDAIELLMAF